MDTGRRWRAVGRCTGADPREAGREAAGRAQAGGGAALVVVFCSGQADPAGGLVGVPGVFPRGPPIGCSSPALIPSGGAPPRPPRPPPPPPAPLWGSPRRS